MIGRFNGQTCVCEKTFHVLACPEVDAQVKEPIEPDSGCLPVRVTYDLDWPGDSEMCDIPYRELGDSRPLERFGPFPITKTYSIIRWPYGEGHPRGKLLLPSGYVREPRGLRSGQRGGLEDRKILSSRWGREASTA